MNRLYFRTTLHAFWGAPTRAGLLQLRRLVQGVQQHIAERHAGHVLRIKIPLLRVLHSQVLLLPAQTPFVEGKRVQPHFGLRNLCFGGGTRLAGPFYARRYHTVRHIICTACAELIESVRTESGHQSFCVLSRRRCACCAPLAWSVNRSKTVGRVHGHLTTSATSRQSCLAHLPLGASPAPASPVGLPPEAVASRIVHRQSRGCKGAHGMKENAERIGQVPSVMQDHRKARSAAMRGPPCGTAMRLGRS